MEVSGSTIEDSATPLSPDLPSSTAAAAFQTELVMEELSRSASRQTNKSQEHPTASLNDLSAKFEVKQPAPDTKHENALFVLSAPNRLWIQPIDWIQGQFPSDIHIKYNHFLKNQTPLVKRLKRHQKQLQNTTLRGRARYDEARLSELSNVLILKGELSNEQVN